MPRLSTARTRAYTYRVTVPPAQLPVLLADVKAYMKVTTTADDALITALISAATDYAEKFTGRDFITRTYETFRDFFPRGCNSEGYYTCGEIPAFGVNSFTSAGGNLGFEIRRSPLQSISQIQYFKSAVLTTVPSSDYYNTLENDYSEVLTVDSALWPDDSDVRLQAITITFISGFGDDPSDMPPWVSQGMLPHISFMYENRGDCIDSTGSCDCARFLPPTTKALYLQNRILNL